MRTDRLHHVLVGALICGFATLLIGAPSSAAAAPAKTYTVKEWWGPLMKDLRTRSAHFRSGAMGVWQAGHAELDRTAEGGLGVWFKRLRAKRMIKDANRVLAKIEHAERLIADANQGDMKIAQQRLSLAEHLVDKVTEMGVGPMYHPPRVTLQPHDD